MARRRKKSATRSRQRKQSIAALQKNGLTAFRRGDYDQAIETWERVLGQAHDEKLTTALAEVYFRRGLKQLYGQPAAPSAGLTDLKRAFTLQPDNPCYAYHAGLAAHHLGDLHEAGRLYVRVCKSDTQFARRAAYPLALSILQRGDDPATHPVWSELTAQEQTLLTQAQTFRRRPYTPSPDAPPVWRAIAALDAGEQGQAQTLLDAVLTDSSEPAERRLAQYYAGVLAAQRGDWEEACRLWIEAHAAGLQLPRLRDNLQEAHHRRAEDLLLADEVEEALSAAREAWRYGASPSLEELISQAHQRLAYQAANNGTWDLAHHHWEAADEIGGGGFRLAYNLALTHERAEEFIAAAERWREALRRRPRRDDHPDSITDDIVAQLWSRAAQAYTKAGEYDEAVGVYRHAVKYNPEHVETRLALAETLLANGQLQAAENELRRILDREPNNIPALLRMGEVIAAGGRWWYWDSPISYWERVLELEPDNAIARQLLAEYYQNEAEYWLSWHRYADALSHYHSALEYQPKNGPLLAALGHCLLVMGDNDEALTRFDEALALDPTDLNVYQEIIHAWFDADDPDRAWETVELAEAALDVVPYEFYLAQAAYCIQDYTGDVVSPWLERVVARAPADVPILIVIGEMATAASEIALGQEYLERAIAAGQAPGQAYLLLGLLALKDNDDRTAEKHWREAKKIARQTGDTELAERIEMARMIMSIPPGLRELIARLGPEAFGGPSDFWGDEWDDEDWEDDDYF